MTAASQPQTVASHRPVMVQEICAVLAPADAATLVDGTFGAGGYAQALLDTARCIVWAIDRDPDAIGRGKDIARRYHGRLHLVPGNFADMDALLRPLGVESVAGVALDLGVSSPQLDDPDRGFSFQHDGPLDMRMGREGPSAADFVNSASAQELSDVIFRFGEERHSRAIARAIVAARLNVPITRTGALADIVAGAARGHGHQRVHPATRTFQALRIHVNNEVGPRGDLRRGLAAAERLLAPGGRLVVVAFHSLEDREVKQFLAQRAGARPHANRFLPSADHGPAPTFSLMFKGARRPSSEEVSANPRARSARLRAAVRTAAPAWREAPAC